MLASDYLGKKPKKNNNNNKKQKKSRFLALIDTFYLFLKKNVIDPETR